MKADWRPISARDLLDKRQVWNARGYRWLKRWAANLAGNPDQGRLAGNHLPERPCTEVWWTKPAEGEDKTVLCSTLERYAALTYDNILILIDL
jgi:hypothetical protein